DAARSVSPDKDKLWGPKNIDFIKKQFKMAPADIPQKTLDEIAGKMEKLELKGEALADGLFKAAEEIDKETERMNTELANKVNQRESERIAFHSKVNEKVYNLNVDLQERLTKLRKDNEDEAVQYGTKATEESIRERIKKDEEYALKKLRKEREKARKDGSLNGENAALFDQLEKATQAKYVNIAKAQIAEYLRKKMQDLEQFYKELTGKELQNEQDALKLRPDDLNLRKQVIRDETRYNEGKVIAEYDELEQKSQGKDAVRITRDKIAAINNVRKEGNAKMLEAETEHYDQLNALVEQRYDIVMDYLEAELNEKMSATNDPEQKEELKKQAESLKYYREEQKLLEQLANAKEKLKRIEAEREKGGNSVVTEKDVLEARRNVSQIIAQITKLISARKALEEADKHEKKKRILGEVDYTVGNVDKTIQGIGSILNAFIDAEQQKTAVLIEEQQKRVNRANEIAKGGNTEMLKAEQDRLAALEKKQRDYVDKQRFLNSLLIASQQAVNITQAITGVLSAAPGDPYSLPARVIAAVAAIVFGIAAVTTSLTSINSKTGYAKGGYTGDGGRHDEAGVVHKGEYVMPQDTVKRYGRQTLEAIHYGRIPIEVLQGNMMQVNYAGMLRAHNSARVGNAYDMRKLEGKFDLLLEAYNNNGGTQVSIDENGFVAIYNQHVKNKTRINKLR
ncbi:MAG TPA: hypothetical protein VEB40_13755, partial [Flavipsychrobacter sp.]|nr:hypothetical protein [Flavipsychrobacter sp.]